jgi:competence protein ComEA
VPDQIPARSRRSPASDTGLTPDPAFWGDDRPRRRIPPRPQVARGLEQVRDRFQDWRADSRLGVIALVVVAVIVGVVWYRVGVSRGSEAPSRRSNVTAIGARAGSTSTSTTAAKARVVVHIAGAVTHPGVVELSLGARVIDAIEAVGGGLPEADLDRLNLAAKLADGQRVLVQRVGDPVVAETGIAAPGTSEAPGGLLNLNTATSAQLEELPGIGPALAGAIIDERVRRGSFRSVNELRDVRGIGEKRFADLRDRVTV